MPEGPRRICVVTGSRADYGLLYWVMRGIQQDPALELQVVATGMHLSPEFGLTHREIEADGFGITATVEMLLSADTASAVAKSMGLGVIGFADVLQRLRPDILLVLGDRFEIFAAAQASLIARVPIAHIAGGDTTEAAFDEALRHGITKMAQLHFVTNDVAARRVRQMGEDPANVFVVGSPGIDYIVRMERLGREELEASLGCRLHARNLLVTFHPATLDRQPAEAQFGELLQALDSLDGDTGLFFTMPNADTDGRSIIRMIEQFAAERPHARAFTSLGQKRYLSLMSFVDAVVGNSSSGLYEAPSLGKPTVDIGERQRGRLRADSVIHCDPVAGEIGLAIRRALALDASQARNPYGDGNSSERIVERLRSVPDPRALLKKRFHDIGAAA